MNDPLTRHYANLPDRRFPLHQHMLMAGLTEDFDRFLLRVARLAVKRLVVMEDEEQAKERPESLLLAQIRMAARLRRAIDEVIRSLVVSGTSNRAEALLNEILGGIDPQRPTWQEIGEALGVSAQAAHRKYGRPVNTPKRSMPK